RKDYSIAENILYMLHGTNKFTKLEARALDLCLVLQAEHGGGNNSTFTTHVVTSSGTDTYSAVVASLASLKGPRHGGAALKVVEMMKHIKANIKDCKDETVADYLTKMLNKEVFDKTGLIYGIGHAVYSLSDPRVDVLKSIVKELAHANGWDEDFELYDKIEKLAPEIISNKRKMYKGVSANVDFYTGLIYQMIRIPTEMYITLFAIARVVGWGAHRIEELANNGKIIRPAYIAVSPRQDYKKITDRE
ncbi:MAG: citrate/2-methylcitrate synthase, partial [Bacilli bacterium]|nr:citrate/2-methylcitrate synthase [Bacilli bacterium]